MPDLVVGIRIGEADHARPCDAVAYEFEERLVGMERHVDDEIGRRGVETGSRGTVAPSLSAVTGGTSLGVDPAAYGERLRVGRKRVPVSRYPGLSKLRGKDDTRSDHKIRRGRGS